MYLKSITLENFRKFQGENNRVEFIDAKDYMKDAQNGINIAPKTTIIVGKNNTGKTTVIEALGKLINTSGFKASDFNFNYLNKMLNSYTKDYLNGSNVEVPNLEFKIVIGIINTEDDYLTNIIPFMTLDDAGKSEVDIIIKYEIKDKELFIKDMKKFIKKDYKDQRFDRFLELINETEFEILYYNLNEEKKNDFSLKKLI